MILNRLVSRHSRDSESHEHDAWDDHQSFTPWMLWRQARCPAVRHHHIRLDARGEGKDIFLTWRDLPPLSSRHVVELLAHPLSKQARA